MDRQELLDEVRRIRWYHRIDLGDGIITPRGSQQLQDAVQAEPSRRPRRQDRSRRRGWDGFYSFEAEHRGAERVLATDSYSWSGAGWGSKAGFELARRALGSHVEDRDVDVLDLSPEEMGVFDVVLFLGVLYHMRDQLRALERIRSLTGDCLILETHVALLRTRRPAAAFYPADELNRDHSNWWGRIHSQYSACSKLWASERRISYGPALAALPSDQCRVDQGPRTPSVPEVARQQPRGYPREGIGAATTHPSRSDRTAGGFG
jgi:tRNA (mo5U34)-methyltransferase